MNTLFPRQYYYSSNLGPLSPFMAQDLGEPVLLPKSLWHSQQMNIVYGDGFFSNLGAKFSRFFSKISPIMKKAKPVLQNMARDYGPKLLNLGVNFAKDQIGDSEGGRIGRNALDFANKAGSEFLGNIEKNTTKPGAREFLQKQAMELGKEGVREGRKQSSKIDNDLARKLANFGLEKAGSIVGAGVNKKSKPSNKIVRNEMQQFRRTFSNGDAYENLVNMMNDDYNKNMRKIKRKKHK